MAPRTKKPAPLKLYWYTTPEHAEDWFVVARSARDARRFAVRAEGFGSLDFVNVELIMRVPESERPRKLLTTPEDWTTYRAGWPTNEALDALGAKFHQKQTPRVLTLAGRTFAEGMFEGELNRAWDDLTEAQDGRRPYGTRRRARGVEN